MLWYLLLPLTVSSLHTGGFNRGPTFVAATSLDASNVIVDSSTTTTREQRAERAKKTWSTIALQPTRDESETISLQEASQIYDAARFKEFCNVKGTFFINGLGSCQIGDRLMHPFEAHGLVKSLAFDGQGSLHFTKRLVQTELTEKEVAQNRALARGVMSTVAKLTFPESLVNMMSPSDRDTANLVAHLWPLPGKSSQEPLLITCTDNGEPHALDPKTLETKGKLVDFLPTLELKNRLDGKKLLAHTRVDEDRERMVLCINTMEIPGDSNEGNSTMEFIEVDPEWNIVSSRSFTTRFMVFHDWVMTENYYVVPKNPAVLKWGDLAKFLVGTSTGTSIFAMDEACPGELILIPRHDENAPVLEVKDDEFFNIFHFGPAHEEENGELVVYSSSFDQYKFGREMGFDGPTQTFDPIAWGASGDAPPPRLDKFVVDLETQTMLKRRLPIVVDNGGEDNGGGDDIPIDMPTFAHDAKKCRYCYFVGASRPEGWFPFRSIVKFDFETEEACNWDAGDHQVTSEAMYIPRTEKEDDGFVVSIVHNSDTKTCRLMVWDSPTFESGPIASVALGDLVPWCVHGSWYPEYNP